MKNTLKKRIVSVLLTLSLLSGASLFAFAQDDLVIDSSDNAILNDLTTDEEDDYTPRYVEDEVIIMLADTPETENLQLYSVYSDDYQTLNLEATEKVNASRSAYALNSATETVTVAGSTNAIEDILDLGIEITEMKMLNPQSEDERVNTASVSRSANASDSVEELYTVGEENNNVFSIKLGSTTVNAALNILNNNPLIEIAEPNYLYSIEETETSTNDAGLTQYALEKINIVDAWRQTTGNKRVVVGIIDTGIEGTHPALSSNLWNNPYYSDGVGCSICSRSDDIHGYNFTGYGSSSGLPCGGTPTDIDGHGTTVAGIIGANSSSPPFGGVCWNVSLAWLGVSDETLGVSLSHALEALNYADIHGIHITNNSYGSYAYSKIFEIAINNYDGLFVVSAGNESGNNDYYPKYPACYSCPNIISVAASTEQDTRWHNSNFGYNSVHVAAPGDQIISTNINGSYGELENAGTSFAAPHIAGIAALIKSKNFGFNTQQIKAAICHSVPDNGENYKTIYDGGVVDAGAAVSVNTASLKSVTFDYNYLGAPNGYTDYTISGNTIIKPETPERTGYIFNGWYTSPSGGTIFNFNSEITQDYVLYAHWTEAAPGTFGDIFPDHEFRNFIISTLNIANNTGRRPTTIISQDDYDTIASLDILTLDSSKIRSLSGLEYLSGLTEINISYNKVSTIDLSNLTALKKLNCKGNGLSNLNLTNNILLEELDCSYNNLSTLDVSYLTNLRSLGVGYNMLPSVDISNNLDLRVFKCEGNQIHSLDISGLEHLEILHCQSNKLSVLNISGLNNLSQIYAFNNAFNCQSDILCEVDDKEGLEIVYDNQTDWLKNPFIDVDSDIKAVQYVYENELMDGITATSFMPNATVSRAEFAQILYNLAGTPAVNSLSNPFNDINIYTFAEYGTSIVWAYTNGFIESVTATTFNPDGAVTREVAALALYRYADEYDIPLADIREYTAFADESSISANALTAVQEMYEACLINPTSVDDETGAMTFSPNATLTRIDTAVLIRLFEVCRLYL